jgi:hypothetical protein
MFKQKTVRLQVVYACTWLTAATAASASHGLLVALQVEDAQIAKADAMKDMWVVQVAGSDNRYLLPK